MSSPHLIPQAPISLLPTLVTPFRTFLTIRLSPHSLFQDYTAFLADGSILLSSHGTAHTASARRELRDSTGLPLYSLRRDKSKFWAAMRLELPGSREDVMRITGSGKGKAGMGFQFRNAGDGDRRDVEGDVVRLELRAQDSHCAVVHLARGEELVAVVRRGFEEMGKGCGQKVRFRPEWEVEIAAGLDLGLIAIIVISLACRVDHPWSTGKLPPKKEHQHAVELPA